MGQHALQVTSVGGRETDGNRTVAKVTSTVSTMRGEEGTSKTHNAAEREVHGRVGERENVCGNATSGGEQRRRQRSDSQIFQSIKA